MTEHFKPTPVPILKNIGNAQDPTFLQSNFWEERYLDGDTPWDKGAAAPPLSEYLLSNSVKGKVCVPGCGLGHDVRALAEQGAVVTGLDIAPSAIHQAENFPRVNCEQYLKADFFQAPVELKGHFDWIFEHTCFCAINPARRQDYVQACVNVLKPGGHLLALFFMNPQTDPGDGPPFGVTLHELDQLFGSDFELIHDHVPLTAYSGREGRERLRLLKRKS